ncbi:MAG: Na/Pi cotransporter family protein, partial [Planctomycetota bacterium]
WVRLGSRNGRWNVEARIARREKEKARFTTIAGAVLEPGPFEGVVGSQVPIRLRLLRMPDPAAPEKLEPIPDRQILFSLVASPEHRIGAAEVRDKRNVTDAEGLRSTEIRLGSQAGVYSVLAEIDAAGDEDPLPAIVVNVTALDWVTTALRFAGSILLFVVGVRLVGSGFLLLAAGPLRFPGRSPSAHPVRAYLSGILAGATFQSASIVILHVISFCNGGLLDARGAIGILLGASLGGTLLPQLLSQGIDALSVPFLAVGVGFFLARRRLRLAPWGWAFLGAGLILSSWGLLDEAASQASSSRGLLAGLGAIQVDPSAGLRVFLPRFFSYFLAATAVSFVLRTSNLLVVAAMALVARGLLAFESAVPIVLGANLGASAMISVLSARKRREARRAAVSHLLVQIAGCAAFFAASLPLVSGSSPLVWIVEQLVPGRALSLLPENPAQHVATVHTIYNLLLGLVFAAVPGSLLGQADRLLGSEPSADDAKPVRLDPNLVAVPALAIRQATEESIVLTEIARRTIAEAFDAFRYGDLDLAEQVSRREEVVASMHRELTRYLVEVAGNPLSERDAEQIEVLQTAAGAVAGLAALGDRLRDLAARKIEERLGAIEEVDRDLGEVYDLVMAQFENAIALIRARDPRIEEAATKAFERLAKLSSRVAAAWRHRIERSGGANPLELHLQVTIYQEAFEVLFRIASGLAQLAERTRILRTESR